MHQKYDTNYTGTQVHSTCTSRWHAVCNVHLSFHLGFDQMRINIRVPSSATMTNLYMYHLNILS